MKISEEGIELLKKFEGCKLEAYQDSVGVWTIGYGHTKGVYKGMTISQDDAEEMLEEEMEEYEGYIEEYVEVPLSQNEFDALVCWVYNLGPTNLRNSTLLMVLNQSKFDEVPEQIKRWNKAGGEVLKGLVRRREAEALLFEGKDWHNI
tara:strand:- start:1764 stop:2207 length:444 start_codon:yes stop_codon:yes gene_type:complete